MTYGFNDLKILKKDTNPDNPQMFTPKFEVPGDLWNQEYPKRLRHSFPDTRKWKETVDVDGEETVRWKKYLYNHYVKKNID